MEREDTNNSLLVNEDMKNQYYDGDGMQRRSSMKKASFFIGGGDPDAIPVKIIGPNNQEIAREEIVVPPDGGWGWVIVFAAFMSNLIVDGIIFSFGVMMNPIIESSGRESSIVAWVGSLLTGFYLMAGPFVSALANRFGFRPVAILGSVVGALAFTSSWFFCRNETNIGILFALYGVIGGIGFGMIYVPAVVAVGFYFEKKRALATGIAICGSGVGTFIFAPLVNFLVDNFGWEKSLLFQSAIILCCGLLGCLYRPLLPKQVSKDDGRRASNLTPYASPEGTPLLMRIKKARDMEKWDSVNSFGNSNETLTDGRKGDRSRAEQLYNQARKASTHSLTNAGLQMPIQQKRMSVPSMLTGGDAQTQQQLLTIQRINSTTRVKSFIGLSDLKEIGEEDEHISDDSPSPAGGSREMSVVPEGNTQEEQSNDTATPMLTITESSPTPTPAPEIITDTKEAPNNATTNVDAGKPNDNSSFIDGNENTTMLNKNNSTTVTMIGSSTLTVNEMTRSRVLRVASRVTLNKPMYRDDIFYSGSMIRIPEYKKTVDTVMTSVEWTAAVSRVPEGLEEEDPEEVCCSMNIIKKMLDFSLLLSPTFILLAVSGGFTMLGFFVPFMYLKVAWHIIPNRFMTLGMAQGCDIDKSSATMLISIIGIANTVGRIMCGWIADRPSVNALMVNNGALTVGGIVTFIAPFLRTYPLLVGYSCAFGLSMACFASLRSILLVELLGLSKLTNAFGLLLMFQGIAAMVGSPLAGFLFDFTGTYNMSFHVAGGLILLSGLMCYPLNYINKWETEREARKLKLKENSE